MTGASGTGYDATRATILQWLKTEEGYWTATEVAREVSCSISRAHDVLRDLAEKGEVVKVRRKAPHHSTGGYLYAHPEVAGRL